MKDKTKALSVVCALFMGIVIGFFCAPIKKGIHIEIKNNGNSPLGTDE